MPKRSLAIVAALVASFTLAACANTVRGVGTDVRQTGDAIGDVTE